MYVICQSKHAPTEMTGADMRFLEFTYVCPVCKAKIIVYLKEKKS